MRVLFLDFDGVLNSHDWWTRRGEAITERAADLRREFDPVAVARLNEVTRDGVQIVVSSSWRYGRSVEQLRKLLVQIGVTAPVLDKTVDRCESRELATIYMVEHAERGAEIAEWLSGAKGVETYAIVDDDYDAGVSHAGHFVKTRIAVGLTDADVARLREILFPGGQR